MILFKAVCCCWSARDEFLRYDAFVIADVPSDLTPALLDREPDVPEERLTPSDSVLIECEAVDGFCNVGEVTAETTVVAAECDESLLLDVCFSSFTLDVLVAVGVIILLK
jgi:hypothetical protein